MTRWDTDNLNAAHTMRELEQEWGPVIDCEIGGRNVFADLGFENADVMALQSENKGLLDRVEQLELELTEYRGICNTYAEACKHADDQIAAEKALSDRLWREWRSWVGEDDEHLVQPHEIELETTYRKARGL